MYAYELYRRLRRAGTPVCSITYDPGFLPDTGMGLGAPAIFRSPVVKFLLRKLGMDDGTDAAFRRALGMLADDSAYAGSSGRYFHSKNGVLSETRSSVMSHEDHAAVTLWSDSEQLMRLKDSERPVALRMSPVGG